MATARLETRPLGKPRPQHAGEIVLRRIQGRKGDRAVQQRQAIGAAPLDRKPVAIADEAGGEAGRRPCSEVLAATDLLDAAAIHQHDPVCQLIASSGSWVRLRFSSKE